MNTRFKIGDKVKVIDRGECYPHYQLMAEKMGLWMWFVGNDLRNGDEGIITAIETHPDIDKIVYGISSNSENGREYIINERGLEFVGVIKIDRSTLNEYYDAATSEQKKFLNDNFKLDGTTTVKAVRKLYDIAYEKWKKIIKENHPECFEDDKYFTEEELRDMLENDDITIRGGCEYKGKGFYLHGAYNWELKVDSVGVTVLIPTKK